MLNSEHIYYNWNDAKKLAWPRGPDGVEAGGEGHVCKACSLSLSEQKGGKTELPAMPSQPHMVMGSPWQLCLEFGGCFVKRLNKIL